VRFARDLHCYAVREKEREAVPNLAVRNILKAIAENLRQCSTDGLLDGLSSSVSIPHLRRHQFERRRVHEHLPAAKT
jgi:hypothetical protein